MAYVRERGNQLCIVHGAREPKTGKVQQEILFTIYSKEEALAALGKNDKAKPFDFKLLLEHQYPEIRFSWKTILNDIKKGMAALPDTYQYGHARTTAQFYPALKAFTKALLVANPQNMISAAELIQQHKLQLEYISELIAWRVKTCRQEEGAFKTENPFYWRIAVAGSDVPCEDAHHAEELYEKGELDKAEAALLLLVDCFEGYGDGYNYLGLIRQDRGKLKEAIEYFRKAIEVGRSKLRKRMARKDWWNDISTRPYMRALMNLAGALNRSQLCDEALRICDQLENECASKEFADYLRSRIYLNMGKWKEALAASLTEHRIIPDRSFLAAFASYELGQHLDALTHFIYAALNCPFTAACLTDISLGKVTSSSEAQDHNSGVDILNTTVHFRAEYQSSDKFFQNVMRDPRMKALVGQAIDLGRRRYQEKDNDNKIFKALTEMRTWEFAAMRAAEMIDLFQNKKTSRARSGASATTVH